MFNIVQIVFRLDVLQSRVLHFIISVGVFVLVYIGYTVEVFFSSTFRYLWNRRNDCKLKEYVASIKQTRPEIQFWGESSHPKVEHNLRRDGLGGDVMYTTTKNVVTFRATENFRYSRWHDESEFSGGSRQLRVRYDEVRQVLQVRQPRNRNGLP